MVWLMRLLKYLAVLAITGLVAGFVVMMNVQSDYYQKVRTLESHIYGLKLTDLLTEFYGRNNYYPQELDEVQPPQPDEVHVGSISYQYQTGIVRIQLADDNDDWGVLLFDPALYGDTLIYTCHGLKVPTVYLPVDCLPE